MTIQQIILGFLHEGAKSGYTLKKEIVAVPFFHSTANNNQIYTALLQLHRAGLVDVALQVKERGAASKLYSLTPAGERELQSWVVTTPEGSEYYSHFHQQLAFAHRLSQPEVVALFAAYEEKTKTLLAIAQELQLRFGKAHQANPGDTTAQRRALLWGAIFEQRRQVYELELTWLQQTRANLLALYTNSSEGNEQL
jgi:DNA-binding PadR family transcriptional regulator